jgi:hypothetical protein
MSTLSQAKLERRVEVLVSNGKLPAAQAVIAAVGYTPAGLEQGAALLAAVRTGRGQTQALLAEQKRATGAEAQARQAAQQAMVSLGQTARAVFAADEATLTALGLRPIYASKLAASAAEGGGGAPAGQPSESTAEKLKRWRQLVDNALALPTAAGALLAAAGWPAPRLTAAQALVEAYAAADTSQQAAIQAYQAASGRFTADVAALSAWYTRAAGLIRVAIKDAGPADQAQLRELLGLEL